MKQLNEQIRFIIIHKEKCGSKMSIKLIQAITKAYRDKTGVDMSKEQSTYLFEKVSQTQGWLILNTIREM